MRALIDAELYLYQAATGAEHEVEWDTDDWTYVCRHTEARIAFQEKVAEFMESLPNQQPVMVFSEGLSFRYGLWPQYKANRKKRRKPAGYKQLREWVFNTARGRGWEVASLADIEGDDVLGVLYEEGDVIVSHDKDMKTLPGRHLINGEIHVISEREANLAFFTQALTGDTSDNYPGCPKFGPVTAAKLLAGLQTEQEMWKAVLGAYEKAGFNERYAITQARCARILRSGEYDHAEGIPLLWNPPVA